MAMQDTVLVRLVHLLDRVPTPLPNAPTSRAADRLLGPPLPQSPADHDRPATQAGEHLPMLEEPTPEGRDRA